MILDVTKLTSYSNSIKTLIWTMIKMFYFLINTLIHNEINNPIQCWYLIIKRSPHSKPSFTWYKQTTLLMPFSNSNSFFLLIYHLWINFCFLIISIINQIFKNLINYKMNSTLGYMMDNIYFNSISIYY